MRASMAPPDGYSWRFVWSAPIAGDDSRGDVDRLPISVREGAPGGRCGVITCRVRRGQSEAATAETLIHEVAHAFDMWTHHGHAGDHSATWGVLYARVYCAYWGVS